MPPRATFTDRVPLGASAFFLKFGELPSVVDGDQQFPDKQSRQAKEQDCSCHRQKHHQNVWTLGAVWMEGGRDKGMSKVRTERKIRQELGWRKSGFIMLFPPCLLLHSHGFDVAFAATGSFAECYDFTDSEDTVMLVIWLSCGSLWHDCQVFS